MEQRPLEEELEQGQVCRSEFQEPATGSVACCSRREQVELPESGLPGLRDARRVEEPSRYQQQTTIHSANKEKQTSND